jgi:hypothetical protein
MRPTVIAYRLLQPVKERRTSTTSGFDLRIMTRAATLFTFCGRGDSPFARTRPTDREPRALVRPPRVRFFP